MIKAELTAEKFVNYVFIMTQTNQNPDYLNYLYLQELNTMNLVIFMEIRPHAAQGLETQNGKNVVR